MSEPLTLQESADYLKIHENTLYLKLKSGEIKGYKVGKLWRFYTEDLDKYIRGEK